MVRVSIRMNFLSVSIHSLTCRPLHIPPLMTGFFSPAVGKFEAGQQKMPSRWGYNGASGVFLPNL